MSSNNHHIDLAALPHYGALLQRIRVARGISPADITRICGFEHQTTVDRLEAGRLPRRDTVVERYLAGLGSVEALPPELAITERQRDLLHHLYMVQRRPDLAQAEASAAAISTRTILPEYRPAALDPLVRELAQTPYPALIMDDLWFDHAINGTLCNIFDIPRTPVSGTTRLRLPDLFFERWEMWHSIGIKIPRASPLRHAYALSDPFFLPLALQGFFEDSRVGPHLFGAPMRRLLARLRQSAEVEDYHAFGRAWYQVTAMIVPAIAPELMRIITYRGQSLPFRLTIANQAVVRMPGGYTTTYALALWEPDSSQSSDVLSQLRDPTIYYAADHDPARQFHLNDWPDGFALAG